MGNMVVLDREGKGTWKDRMQMEEIMHKLDRMRMVLVLDVDKLETS